MASTSVLLLQLLLVSLATASHFFGGSTTFTFKEKKPDGTIRVDIRHRDTFDGCQFSLNWNCFQGDCGTVNSTERGVIDNSTKSPQSTSQWCETVTVDTRYLPNDKPFQLRAASCCWIANRNLLTDWRLLTSLDLGARSDTGKPNRSPEVAILPFLRVPQNCPRTYKLLSYDPDHDKVRCRYGNITNIECGSCIQPRGFALDEDSCTLHYENSTADPRVYGFELVVEDFPKKHISRAYSDGSYSAKAPLNVYNTTTTPSPPLSQLPLQFSFLVDPAVPSCHEGYYLPKLVYPTPLNGARIQAEVNKEVEIVVKAKAFYATIHDIIISGPLNITTEKKTHGEFVIRWTPSEHDLGNFFPICFAVESVNGSGIFQSEMRCVLVEVRKEKIKSTVTCTESTMTVEVETASLHGLNGDHLRLNDATNIACRVQSNSTHIFAVIPLNDCGTEIEEDGHYLRFKNEITALEHITDKITRKNLLEVHFFCQYSKKGNVTQSFIAHRKKITVWERGFGTFTYQFEFFFTDQYKTMVDPNSYPLVFELKQRIYMQIEATTHINNTVLFVESCRATPYDNKNYHHTYSIIENGCIVDPTVVIYNSSQRQFRFSIQAFKFIGFYNQVYISCNVLMCEAGSPNTRYSQGCINSTMTSGWNPHHHRRKREAVAQTSRHLVSQGPLRLKRSAESNESSALHLNMNLVFIAGFLLAAVGMISAVVMYKAKVSKVKYQPLATFES